MPSDLRTRCQPSRMSSGSKLQGGDEMALRPCLEPAAALHRTPVDARVPARHGPDQERRARPRREHTTPSTSQPRLLLREATACHWCGRPATFDDPLQAEHLVASCTARQQRPRQPRRGASLLQRVPRAAVTTARRRAFEPGYGRARPRATRPTRGVARIATPSRNPWTPHRPLSMCGRVWDIERRPNDGR